MDVQIKQEICDDEDGNTADIYFDYSNAESVKEEEELVINNDEEEFSHFLESDDHNDFGYTNEYSDEDEYMYDDDEEENGSNIRIKLSKSRRQKGKSKFGLIDEEEDSDFSDTYKKILKLQKYNCIRIVCPICHRSMKAFRNWGRHLNITHPEFSEKIKSNYDFETHRKGVCKHCNETFHFHVNHFLHYLTSHSPDENKLFLCNICNHTDINMAAILKHIDENHSKRNDLYRMCPLCASKFPHGILMRQHFMVKHYTEFKTKFKYYNCHLCNHPRFHEESHYYDHLMNMHGLYGYDWEHLNFRQVGSQEQPFECTKCSKTCVNTGPHSLLEHYLTHQDNCSWYCKYCESTFKYKDSHHMCVEMYKFYHRNDINCVKHDNFETTPPSTSQKVILNANRKLDDWKEFEAYIIHICPYCNDEFNDFQQWQLHLRQQHYINTLKGLGMSFMADDPDNFRCLQCDTIIAKNSVDLHTHCFQHLPYMPYKCRHCSKSLGNEKIAIKHALDHCKNDNDSLSLEDIDDLPNSPKLFDDDYNWIEIICTLCDNEQFLSIADIETHFKTKHNSFEKNYRKNSNNLDMVCKKCRTTIRSVDSDICLSHYISHMKDGPYRCLQCQRTYTGFEICKKHVRRLHLCRPRPKKTKILNRPKRPTKKQKNYNKPFLIQTKTDSEKEEPNVTKQGTSLHNGLGTSSAKANILNEFQEFITYACPECNERFEVQSAWSDHVNTEHTFFNDSELSEFDSTVGKHKCKHCKLLLDSGISQRQKHKLTHMPYKSFVCAVCDARCNTLGVLYGHLRRRHFSKGTFECPICLVNLTTSYERSKHVNQTHPRSEWPTSMCLICYRKFKSLHTHMLSHDINRPKHICHECGVSIIYLKDFQIHMQRKHSAKINDDIKPVAQVGRDEVVASEIQVSNIEMKDTSIEGNTKINEISNKRISEHDTETYVEEKKSKSTSWQI